MNLEQAIRTAMEYEAKVHRTYAEALEQSTDEVGKRVFRTLCEEERGHLKYLKERLDEWRSTGTLTLERLETAIPSREHIEDAVTTLRDQVKGRPRRVSATEVELLERALKVEVETSNFYNEMVRTLDSQGQALFARFVEIEEGHRAIVQAELDCVSGLGFWFDSREFTLEG
jgi:rubrerythrin